MAGQRLKGSTSCGYIVPKIIEILNDLPASRVLDIGSGNGKLCHEITTNGIEAVGMEYDEQGVEIARSNYPKITFYNLGAQDMPSNILEQEEPLMLCVYGSYLTPLFSTLSSYFREGGNKRKRFSRYNHPLSRIPEKFGDFCP